MLQQLWHWRWGCWPVLSHSLRSRLTSAWGWLSQSRSPACSQQHVATTSSSARHLVGTQPGVPVPTCNSPQPLLGALGGFEVSSGCGDAVGAVPKPCSLWLCVVGMCSGVMLWLCFQKALSMWEKNLWWQLLLACSCWLSPQILAGRWAGCLVCVVWCMSRCLFHALKKPWWCLLNFSQLALVAFTALHGRVYSRVCQCMSHCYN